MLTIDCKEHIRRFTPPDVFDAGTLSKNLPRSVFGFHLEVRDERIHKDSELSMHLDLPIPGYSQSLDAYVTDFREEELVVIEASDPKIGDAALRLALMEHDQDGTLINYSLEVDGISRLKVPIVKPVLKQIVSSYAGIYTGNVKTDLNQRTNLKRAA